jgi:hypothetical protein
MSLKVLLAKTCSIFLQVEGKYKVRAVAPDDRMSEEIEVTIEDVLKPTMVDFVIEDEAPLIGGFSRPILGLPDVKIKPKRRPCREKPNENPEERDCL